MSKQYRSSNIIEGLQLLLYLLVLASPALMFGMLALI